MLLTILLNFMSALVFFFFKQPENIGQTRDCIKFLLVVNESMSKNISSEPQIPSF